MPYKFDDQGNLATAFINGKKVPIFIGADGSESPLDAEATFKRIDTLGAAVIDAEFLKSKFVSGSLKLPADVVAATFRGNFKLDENGTIAAVDDKGEKMWSSTRFGEPANFEEAITALVSRHQHKAALVRETAAPAGAPASVASSGAAIGGVMTRAAWDALEPRDRAQHFKVGGRLAERDNATPVTGSGASANSINGKKSITREEFVAASPIEQMAHFKAGGVLSD